MTDEVLEPTKVLYKTARGKYKPYNDTRNSLKENEMIKKITTTIKENKKAIQKRIIVIAGTALGAFVAGVLVARTEAPFDEVIVVEEDVTVEELPGEEIPTEN